jgi:uncharacterized Fe-S cluster protein YjdI
MTVNMGSKPHWGPGILHNTNNVRGERRVFGMRKNPHWIQPGSNSQLSAWKATALLPRPPGPLYFNINALK